MMQLKGQEPSSDLPHSAPARLDVMQHQKLLHSCTWHSTASPGSGLSLLGSQLQQYLPLKLCMF